MEKLLHHFLKELELYNKDIWKEIITYSIGYKLPIREFKN